MDNLITNLCTKFNRSNPKKPRRPPHRHTPIIYGAKFQYTAETPTRPPLDSARKLRIEQLVGDIRYYDQDVDKKLLLALSELSQQQSSPIDDTNRYMLQLLDYLTTYLNDVITYCASDMILAGHANAAYLNLFQHNSHAGSQIML